MMLFVLTLPVLFGSIGLAIDRTILYLVEQKLGTAVDGAALGAGRLLGTTANTTEIAKEFLQANFPAHYWNSTNLQLTANYSVNAGLSTITVNASVTVPLIFLRVLHVNTANVYANAVATRRTARTMLVLDRSGSMNTTDPISGLNVFTEMQQGAEGFVGMFTPGVDEVGLVVLGSSALVAYPTTRPYNNSPTSSGGPDTSFDTSATSGPTITQLQAMAAGGGTGTAEALSLAYIELQKAHHRDFAANSGIDNTQNSIVLFTDGVPDAIAVSPNSASNNSISSSSTCTYKVGSGGTLMMGTIVTSGNAPPVGWGSPSYGLFLLTAYDATHTLTWWLQNASDNVGSGDLIQASPATAVANCTGLAAQGLTYVSQVGINSDLSRIPPYDIYGNSTSGSGYTLSTLDLQNGTSTHPYASYTYNPNNVNDGNSGAIAAWNAMDNVGNTIRSQTAMNPVTIYAIGYSGDGGTDATLLKRLANTQDSTSYNASQATGVYIQVNSASQLGAAFNDIASQLLRLAK
jgi:Flp pilus assembly protein TadG